jgi:hypothetical protein
MSVAVQPISTMSYVLRGIVVLGVGLLAFMGLRFFGEAAIQYFDIREASYGYYWPNRGWLLMHLIGGSLALLMGPFQLWSGLRRRHMHIHRWTGRLYIAGVVLAAFGSFTLAVRSPIGVAWSAGLIVLATTWLAVTSMALLTALYRQIAAHREWMLRSYVLTFSFVIFRALEETPLFADAPMGERFATIGWMSWTVPLMLTELSIQLGALRRPEQMRDRDLARPAQ